MFSPPLAFGRNEIRNVSSSIGRAAVSKTAGWGFDSLLTCATLRMKYLDWLNITGTWWVSIVVLVLLAFALALLARSWNSVRDFTGEVKAELHKASWPWDPKEKGMKKYKELTDSTIMVTIAMLLLSGYVAGWDFLFNMIMAGIFGATQK